MIRRLVLILIIPLLAVAVVSFWFDSPDREVNGVLFVGPGRLSRYETTYANYRSVNVRRLDGTLADRPDDLEILMRELIAFEQDNADVYPLGVKTPALNAYNEQDRQTMRRIIERGLKWPRY